MDRPPPLIPLSPRRDEVVRPAPDPRPDRRPQPRPDVPIPVIDLTTPPLPSVLPVPLRQTAVVNLVSSVVLVNPDPVILLVPPPPQCSFTPPLPAPPVVAEGITQLFPYALPDLHPPPSVSIKRALAGFLEHHGPRAKLPPDLLRLAQRLRPHYVSPNRRYHLRFEYWGQVYRLYLPRLDSKSQSVSPSP